MNDLPLNMAACDLPARVEELHARILGRLGGRARGLQVVVWNHGIVLKGQVPSYYAKQLAQQAVMEATNLPILANDIEVF
jgi:hypothetical protein